MPFEVFLLISFFISPLVRLSLWMLCLISCPALALHGQHTPSPSALCACKRDLLIPSSVSAPSGKAAAPSLRHFRALMEELFSADGNRLTQSPHRALECQTWGQSSERALLVVCITLIHARPQIPAQIPPQLCLAGLKAAHSIPRRASPTPGSPQARQPCNSSCFPLEIPGRTHPAPCKAGIPNLPGLLLSMYNEDYGLIPASQGGAVGIARVKALRQRARLLQTFSTGAQEKKKNTIPLLFAAPISSH